MFERYSWLLTQETHNLLCADIFWTPFFETPEMDISKKNSKRILDTIIILFSVDNRA